MMNKEIEKFLSISSIVNTTYKDIYDKGFTYSEDQFLIDFEAFNIPQNKLIKITLIFNIDDIHIINVTDESLFSDYVVNDYFKNKNFYDWCVLRESPLIDDLNIKLFGIANNLGLLEFLIFTSGNCFQILSQSSPEIEIKE